MATFVLSTFAFELKLSKAVADQAAYKCLNDSAGKRERCGIKQSRPVTVITQDTAIGIKGGITRDELDRYIDKIVGAHERGHYLREEGLKNNVGNADKQSETEDVPKHINNKANGEVLDLKALPSARTFKVNANAILRLAEHLGPLRGGCLSCRGFLFKTEIHLLTPLIAPLVEYECREHRNYYSYARDDEQEVHPGHCGT